MKYTIPVVTRLQDNGDGGYTTYIYNDKEEMLKNHPNTQIWNIETKKYDFVELSDVEKLQILNENDPYKDGYIGSGEIEVELNGDVMSLTKPLSFHVGQ